MLKGESICAVNVIRNKIMTMIEYIYNSTGKFPTIPSLHVFTGRLGK